MRCVPLLVAVLLTTSPLFAQSRDLVVKPGASDGDTLDPDDLFRAHNSLAEFVVDLSLEGGRTTLVEGESVRFVVRSERSGYVVLLNRNPEGEVYFLYPNEYDRPTRISANETVYFPGATDSFEIHVSPPFGMEFVKAIVTTEPLVRVPASRGLEVKGTRSDDGSSTLDGFAPSQWATAQIRINTAPQTPSVGAPVSVPLAPAPRFGANPLDRWDALFSQLLGQGSSSRSVTTDAPSPVQVADSDPENILVVYRPRTGSRSFGEDIGSGHLFSNLRIVPARSSSRDASGTRSLGQYGQSITEQVDGLNQDPDVLVAVPDYPVSLFGFVEPLNPYPVAEPPSRAHPTTARYWDLQWALYNGFFRSPAERVDLGWMDGLRRYRPSGEPVVVAVLDTGAILDHPALRPYLWTNEVEIPGNGQDDDGNGYVDDIHGWDMVDGDGDPSDPGGFSHGTFVATQIPYNPDATDVFGVAPDVRILPIRVLNEEGFGQTSGILEGIDYAVRNGAKVINLSLGVSSSFERPGLETLYRLAFEAAEEAGILVVMAAGNDDADSRSSYTFPARVRGANTISVAALSMTGDRASFSNYGPQVDMAAPGERIIGHATAHGAPMNTNGTSLAAPYVSAAAAMVMSQNPGWTPAEVKRRLLERVTPLDGLDVSSGGALHIGRALSDD